MFKTLPPCPLYPLYIKRSQVLQKNTKIYRKNREKKQGELGDTLPKVISTSRKPYPILAQAKAATQRTPPPSELQIEAPLLVKKDLISNSFLNSFWLHIHIITAVCEWFNVLHISYSAEMRLCHCLGTIWVSPSNPRIKQTQAQIQQCE